MGLFDPKSLELFNAAESGDLETVMKLLTDGVKVELDMVENTLTKNQMDCAKALIEHAGSSIDEGDFAGRTLLFIAAVNDRIDIAKWCIDKGANLDHVVNENHTPLSAAVWRGYTSMASLLLERGANIECLDRAGNTVFDIAKERERFDTLAFLESHVENRKIAEVICETVKSAESFNF